MGNYTKKDDKRFKEILQGESREEAIKRVKKAGHDTIWISKWLDKLKDGSFKIEKMLEKNDKKREWEYKIFSNNHVFKNTSNKMAMGFQGDTYEQVIDCIDDFIKAGKKENAENIVKVFANLKEILTK